MTTISLFQAVEVGDAELVRQLIQGSDLDINQSGYKGHTVLTFSAYMGYNDVCVALVEAGCEVDRQNRDGDTALMICCRLGNWDMYSYLMACDPKPSLDIQNNDGVTALIESCRWGQHYFAVDLINHGANIEIEANNGHTALIESSMWGHVSIFNDLIEAGALIDPRYFIPKEFLETEREKIMRTSEIHKIAVLKN